MMFTHNKVVKDDWAKQVIIKSNTNYGLLYIVKVNGGYEYEIVDPEGSKTKGFSNMKKPEVMKMINKTINRLNKEIHQTNNEIIKRKKATKVSIKIRGQTKRLRAI